MTTDAGPSRIARKIYEFALHQINLVSSETHGKVRVVNDLFRVEATEHRRNRLEGDVLLTRSVPLWIITALIATISTTLVLWATLGHFSRTERVQGNVVSEGVLSKIFADHPGKIVWLGVKEGDLVARDQPIAMLRIEQAMTGGASPNDERLRSIGEQSKLTLRELGYENGRSSAERRRLTHLIAELDQERDQLQTQLNLQKQAIESTRSSFDAVSSLVEKGFETRTNYEARRQAWLAASAQLETAIQQMSQLAERRSDAEAALAKLPEEHEGKIADLRNSLDGLDQRRIDVESARGFTITAPVSGRVTAVQAMQGRSSDGRMPLLSIVPQGASMQATLFAPSRAVGMARPGQVVRLMYDAFPYQRFGSFTGRISSISHAVLAPDEVDTPIKIQEPVYEIKVVLDQQNVKAFGQAIPLQPGMTLSADIVLDRRSFLEWLLEPLESLRPSA